jgi:hypothetical protein
MQESSVYGVLNLKWIRQSDILSLNGIRISKKSASGKSIFTDCDCTGGCRDRQKQKHESDGFVLCAQPPREANESELSPRKRA